ncbi:MAG: carbohydrate ABC transporter permease [Chloroflexi bacterium]|nr:carbohydrate ABC transporter permease [Chloroflexota bacterium]
MRETSLVSPGAEAAREAAINQAHRSALVRRVVTGTFATVVGLIIFTAVTFPNLWLLDTSFKADDAVWAVPPQYIPAQPTIEKYIQLLTPGAVDRTRELQFWYLYVMNSIYVSTIPAILATIIGALAGYGFARFHFPGAMAMLTLLLVGQMFPGPSLFVPIYFLVNRLSLQDSLLALIVIYTAFHIPVATWLATGFIRTIPIELEESARIDGCSLPQVMWYITIPLAKTGIVTIALLGFMAFWGEYGFASIILETQSKYTASVGLVRQMTSITTAFNMIGAASVMMGLPLIVVLMLMQRQFVRGLTAGALKEV